MKLQQTPVIAGKPSTVTLVTADANGNPINETFDVPPGPTITLPDNLATNDDLAQMVAGTFNLAPQDLRGVGLNWDGKTGTPRLAYGGIGENEPALFSYLLGTDQKGNYRCANGNSVAQIAGEPSPVMLQRFTIEGQNPTTALFPVPFAGDNVLVFLMPYVETINGIPHGRIVELLEPPNRYGCRLSCWNFISRNWENINFRMDILAIGPTSPTI